MAKRAPSFHISMPADVRARVKAAAKAELMTSTQWILRVILAALRAVEGKP